MKKLSIDELKVIASRLRTQVRDSDTWEECPECGEDVFCHSNRNFADNIKDLLNHISATEGVKL